MKIQNSKFPVFSILAIALLGCPVAQASPPTPHEVAERIHNKVRGAIFRITRIVEGAVNRDLEEDTDYDPHYDYEEERYYHEAPLPPPPVRRYSEAPPPREYREREYHEHRREYRDDRESTGITRGGGTEYYTPDLADPNPNLEIERDNQHVVIPPSTPPMVLKSKEPNRNRNTTENRNPPEPIVRESSPPVVSKTEQKPEPKASTTASVEPTRATAVPGKSGFVYPPGAKQEPANMLDVRGLNSGQKARDPRTGEIFIVP